MKDSLLLKTLAAFSPAELAELGHFVRSPFFNDSKRRRQVELLFDYLEKRLPAKDFDTSDLEKEQICRMVFPGKNESELPKVMSELLRVAERFAVVKTVERPDNELFRRLALVRFFQEKNQQVLASRSLRDLSAQRQVEVNQSQQFFYHKYLVELELHRTAARRNDKSGDLNLSATLESLDLFYLVARLEHSNSLLIQSQITALDLDSKLEPMHHFLDAIRGTDYLSQPLAALLEAIFRLLSRPGETEEPFFRLRDLLDQHWESIAPDVREGLASFLRSYCTGRYNKGEVEFLPILFDVIRDHLQKGLLYRQGQIMPAALQNIVLAGLRLKQFEWVGQFLQEHRHRIGGTDAPEEVYRVNLAQLLFARGQFEAASEMLPQRFHDSHYVLGAKRLEIKIYYHTESVLLLPRLDAFKMFVHREYHRRNLTENNYILNNNFYKIMDKLSRPQELQSNAPRIDKLVGKIGDLRVVAEREWLLEQLEALR